MSNRQALHVALLLWGALFCSLTALCVFMNKNLDREKRRWLLWQQITCTVLLLSDALAWGYRGYPGMTGKVIVYVSNFFVFTCSDIILLLFHGYLCCCLFPDSEVRLHLEERKEGSTDKEKYPVIRIRLVSMIAVLALLLVIVSQFTHLYYYIDEANIYHRNREHFLSMILPLSGMILDLSLLIQYRGRLSRELFIALLSYLILPTVAAVIVIFYYGISLVNITISLCMILMFIETNIEQAQMVAVQERKLAEQTLALARQEHKLAQVEGELTESRITSMMSQIRDHFIFNTLSTISGYCKIDPEKADEALTRFARYLRRNMNYLEEKELIPFEIEVRQIEDYVALEQMRFEDRIEFGEDFEVTDFKIPPLTVQPLVENAIKHGIITQGRSGSVCVLTRKEKEQILIEVIDDGIGFDEKEVKKKGSIGLKNVRYRLEHMANAQLTIESKPGEGTRVYIQIPVQEMRQHEGYLRG